MTAQLIQVGRCPAPLEIVTARMQPNLNIRYVPYRERLLRIGGNTSAPITSLAVTRTVPRMPALPTAARTSQAPRLAYKFIYLIH
jgi:hypothetical protein